MIYEKQTRMNAMSPTRSGVISSPDPRSQDIIQGQSGSPVIDRPNRLLKPGKQPRVSNFDGVRDAEDIGTFDETSQTNTLGDEDYVPDTENSVDDHPRVVNGSPSAHRPAK